MTRKELERKIAERTGLSINNVNRVLEAFIELVIETLSKKQKVKIYGFGYFYSKIRASWKARNPKTGEQIEVPEKVVPLFYAGNKLYRAVEKQ